MKKIAYIFPDNSDAGFGLTQALEYAEIESTCGKNGFFNANIIILNWFEGIPHTRYGYITFVRKLFLLCCARILRKRIIVYTHNRQPHKKYNGRMNLFLSRIMLRLEFALASKIIFLSKHTADAFSGKTRKILEKSKEKIVFVPHCNFDEEYKKYNYLVREKTNEGPLKLYFMGPIEEYKNVDILVEVMNRFDPNAVQLSVSGKCPEEIQAKLMQSAKENVQFEFGYLTKEDLFKKFDDCDIAVFPLSLDCCINSSSVLRAFSMHRTVICTAISTVLDMPEGYCYSYTYTTPADHVENLYNTILKVIDDKKKNPAVLREKGDLCSAYLIQHNSQDIINATFKEMMDSLS